MVTINIAEYCSAESNCNVEILACKIAQNKDEKIVLDLGLEGWDIVENGIEQKVKNICDELNIPYTQIEFTSSDQLCKSQTFKHTINLEFVNVYKRFVGAAKIVPSTKFDYGLFCGRATNERLYSFWKHLNWHYSNRGKASMHVDVNTVNESDCPFTSFICEHNELWQNLVPLLPYSDIDEYWQPGDLSYTMAYNLDLWKHHYKDIAIEIVAETSQTPNNFYITEKTLRPISHGKLFLVIGSPEFEQNLKRMGFDIFDDIIDKSYDSLSSYMRVDAVFKSLGDLLHNPVDMNALLPRLQANKRVLENL